MSAYGLMIGIGNEQNWNTEYQLELALEYIENQCDNEAFYEFLVIVVGKEDATEVDKCQSES